MKNYIIIVILLTGFFAKAQQQDLIENTWYLEKFIVDDIEYYPPNNEEVSPEQIQLIIIDNNLTTYSGCNSLDGPIVINQEENYFESSEDGFSQSLAECQYSYNNEFEYDYFGFFQNYVNGVMDPFHYEILSNGEALRLIVTNSSGSKAYYNNAPLSTADILDMDEDNFQLALQSEYLIIKSAKSTAKSVSIYDLTGKLILFSEVSSSQKINTSGLPNGIYIVKLIDDKGKIYTKKIVKG